MQLFMSPEVKGDYIICSFYGRMKDINSDEKWDCHLNTEQSKNFKGETSHCCKVAEPCFNFIAWMV